MKKSFHFVLTIFLFIGTVAQAPLATAAGGETASHRGERNIEQKFRELSDELQRQFVDAVNDFLEKELNNLKDNNAVPRANLNAEIDRYEENLKQEGNDPETCFSLARLYDQKGEGASAIIYAQKAEAIFVERQDVKGVAEARRSLRHYFSKYDYKPEDFKLSK
jgi:hypothetical protein